jgi:HK97 family phage portal protein
MRSLGKELARLTGSAVAALAPPRNDSPIPLVSGSSGGMSNLLGGGSSGTGDPVGQMELMGSVGTLFAVVDGGAEAVAKVSWNLYPAGLTEDERDGKELSGHPALDVLNNPNPFTTRQEFFEIGQQHHDLTGEAWVVVARRGTSTVGPPVELWNVRPDRMSPVPHPEKFIAGYVYSSPDGDDIPLETTQVMLNRRPSPLDPYRGMAPIQSVMNDADAAKYASQWQRNFFVNSAEPGGIIRTPAGKILKDAEFEQLQQRWRQQHRGVANAHRVAILEGGMEWIDRKYTVRDMMFDALRGLSSEQIREAYRFPKFMLGVMEDANRASAVAAELVFGRWYVAGRLARWQQMLNHDFLPLFPGGDRLEFHPVKSDYIPADVDLDNATLTSKVSAFAQLVDKGVPIEQALEIVGLPGVDIPTVSEDTIGRREKMELVQKVYLGVDTVITAVEARRELAAAGWDINPEDWEESEPEEAPQPQLDPAPAPQPQLEPTDPDEAEQAAMAARWRAMAALVRGQQDGDAPVSTPASESSIPGRAEVDDAAAELEVEWTSVLDSWHGQIVRTIETNGDDEIALRESSLPTTYAVDLLTERMAEQYTDGADQLWQDARDQGVDADDLGEVSDPELRDQAEAAVTELAQAWTDAAIVAVRQAYEEDVSNWDPGLPGVQTVRNVTNTEAADRVASMLADLGTARDRAKLTGTLHRARNQGRIAQAKQAPKATYVALEESDDASCDPCRDVDGKEFRNLAAAERAYKTGGYSKCKGRDRCRGTFNARWD